MKTGGEWVSSVLLESLLSEADRVREAAVIAVEDAKWGERPLAVVVPQPGATVDAAALRGHLQGLVAHGALSRIAIPERVVVVDSLPRTSVGKIDKKQLRATYNGLSVTVSREETA